MQTYKVAYNGPHGGLQFTVTSRMFDVKYDEDYFWIWDEGTLMAIIPGWKLISIEKVG